MKGYLTFDCVLLSDRQFIIIIKKNQLINQGQLFNIKAIDM